MPKTIEKYIPANIENKWQEKWEQDGLYHADIDPNQEEILRADHAAISIRAICISGIGMR